MTRVVYFAFKKNIFERIEHHFLYKKNSLNSQGSADMKTSKN